MAGELYQVRGLLTFTPVPACPSSLLGEQVVLRSSDGELFHVSAAAACISNRIKDLLIHGGSRGEIPLPLSQSLLGKVVEYMKHHSAEVAGSPHFPVGENLADLGLSKWDAGFVSVDKDMLFELSLAASLLDIQSLFLLAGAKIAHTMKGKTPEKLQKELRLAGDLPASEDGNIRGVIAAVSARKGLQVPADAFIAANSAMVQGIMSAADRSGVLSVERAEDGQSLISLNSWRHAMWRTAALWDWHVLSEAPETIRDDRDLLLGAIAVSQGSALRFAAPRLKADRELVLEAVRCDGALLGEAAQELRADRAFVWDCVLASPTALAGAAEALRADRELLLEASQHARGSALKGASPALRGDEGLVLQAMALDPEALSGAADALLTNRDFARRAVQVRGISLQYLPPAMQADREIVLAAVTQDPAAAEYAHVSRRSELQLSMPWDKQVSLRVDHSQEIASSDLVAFYQAQEETIFSRHCLKVTKHVQYSAGSTMTANMGQANYIAANSWLDRLPFHERPEIDSVANMWGSVANIGMRLKAFASADFFLLSTPENIITVNEARSIIFAVIVAMDPPEWQYWQPMPKESREAFLSLSAGVVVGHPGGGWKPGNETTWPPPMKPQAAKRPVEAAPRDAGSSKSGAPLGGWPTLAGADHHPAVDTPWVFIEGAAVTLVGVGAKKDGATGTLIRRSSHGKWKVKLNDGGGNALLPEKNLQLVGHTVHKGQLPALSTSDDSPEEHVDHPVEPSVPVSRMMINELQVSAPKPPAHYIAGTWNSWVPEEMQWDAGSRCFRFQLRLGLFGCESFQVLINGSCDTCLHPAEKVDGLPGSAYAVEGPHPRSSCFGSTWVIGKHGLDRGVVGERYEVQLRVPGEARLPKTVEWVRLGIVSEADKEAVVKGPNVNFLKPDLHELWKQPVRTDMRRRLQLHTNAEDNQVLWQMTDSGWKQA